jgi:hypothetical protein
MLHPSTLSASEPRTGKAFRRLPPDDVEAIAAGDVVVVDSKAAPDPLAAVCGTCLPALRVERHALDDVIEADLDDWQANPHDPRTEGAVIRATLTDPANRPMVSAWLADVGIGGAS